MIKKINKLLKWVIVILLILVAILSVMYKYDDCSVCELEYETKGYTPKEFMSIYAEKCLYFKELKVNLSSNLSFG